MSDVVPRDALPCPRDDELPIDEPESPRLSSMSSTDSSSELASRPVALRIWACCSGVSCRRRFCELAPPETPRWPCEPWLLLLPLCEELPFWLLLPCVFI